MKIKTFILQNQEKVVRAAEGAATSDGGLSGGVGYEDKDLLLVTYDKLGGLILEDGNKVKTGSFWDFKGGVAWKSPKVVYVVRVDGAEVEIPKGKKMPMEVEARKIVGARRKVAGVKNSKKVAKKATRVEE